MVCLSLCLSLRVLLCSRNLQWCHALQTQKAEQAQTVSKLSREMQQVEEELSGLVRKQQALAVAVKKAKDKLEVATRTRLQFEAEISSIDKKVRMER